MRFNKGKRYSYYSSYSGSRRSKMRWDRIGVIVAAVVIVVGVFVWFNLSRIQLLIKGYSFSQQNTILSLGGENVDEVLSHDKMEHIQDWIKASETVHYYDEYEQYLSYHDETEVKVVVTTVDDIFDTYVPKLTPLGYKDDHIWDVLKSATVDDLSYLISKQYTYTQIQPYMQVQGFVYTDLEDYMKVYAEKKNYNYAVLTTSYPFIISTNEPKKTYTIQDPTNVLSLVKKGFQFPSSYEPEDLISPYEGMGIAPDCDNALMREEAMKALQEMFNGAKEEGYTLVINSAYRSYTEQQETYESFEKKWGGIYAKEHVAIPGCSEHQSGLGVDLTSQSVVSKEKLVFGDTAEYKWAIKNAHKYGFILRFADGTSNITGIVHEPWHFRYVGKDVAKKIYESAWTLEEYCLNNGVIPKIKENE